VDADYYIDPNAGTRAVLDVVLRSLNHGKSTLLAGVPDMFSLQGYLNNAPSFCYFR
jgi:hypothetical protein